MSSYLLGVKPPTPKIRKKQDKQKTQIIETESKQHVQLQPSSGQQSPFTYESLKSGHPVKMRQLSYKQNTDRGPSDHFSNCKSLEMPKQQRFPAGSSKNRHSQVRQLDGSRLVSLHEENESDQMNWKNVHNDTASILNPYDQDKGVPANMQATAISLVTSLTRRQNKSAPSQNSMVTSSNNGGSVGSSQNMLLQKPLKGPTNWFGQLQSQSAAVVSQIKRHESGKNEDSGRNISFRRKRMPGQKSKRSGLVPKAQNVILAEESKHEENLDQPNLQFGVLPNTPGGSANQGIVPLISQRRVSVNSSKNNSANNQNQGLPLIKTSQDLLAAGISSLASNLIANGQRTKKQFKRQIQYTDEEKHEQFAEESFEFETKSNRELLQKSSLPPIHSPSEKFRESSTQKQHLRRGKGIGDLAQAIPKTSRHLTFQTNLQKQDQAVQDLNQIQFPYRLEFSTEPNKRISQNHTQLITKNKANRANLIQDTQQESVRLKSARGQVSIYSKRTNPSVNFVVHNQKKRIEKKRNKTVTNSSRQVNSTHAEQKMIQQQMLFQSNVHDSQISGSFAENSMVQNQEPLIPNQNQAVTPTKPMRKTWHGLNSRVQVSKHPMVLPVQTLKMSESKNFQDQYLNLHYPQLEEQKSDQSHQCYNDAINSQSSQQSQKFSISANIGNAQQFDSSYRKLDNEMKNKCPHMKNLLLQQPNLVIRAQVLIFCLVCITPYMKEAAKKAVFQISSEKVKRKQLSPKQTIQMEELEKKQKFRSEKSNPQVIKRSSIQISKEQQQNPVYLKMRESKDKLVKQIKLQNSKECVSSKYQMVTPKHKREMNAPLQTLNQGGNSPSPVKSYPHHRDVEESEVQVSINWHGSESSSNKSSTKGQVDTVIAKQYKESPKLTSSKDLTEQKLMNPEKSYQNVLNDTGQGFIELMSKEQSTQKKQRKSNKSYQFSNDCSKTMRFSNSATRQRMQNSQHEEHTVERKMSEIQRGLSVLNQQLEQVRDNITEVVSESQQTYSILDKTEIKSDYPVEQSEDTNLQSNEFGENESAQQELIELDLELKAQLTNVQRGELLGEGTFGKVYQGMYKGKLILEEEKHLVFEKATDQKSRKTKDLESVPRQNRNCNEGRQTSSCSKTLNKLPPKMAIKVVQAEDKRLLRKLYHECELLKTLIHPNIVKYYGCLMHEAKTEASIFMELMPHSLQTSYKNFGPMNEHMLRRHTQQILLALTYLHNHEKKIIHGDLKAANILYDGSNIKLTDFGDSRIMGALVPNLSVSHSGVTFKDIKGSILWMAPEIIRERPVGTRSDIWSLGCTLIELATAQRPWPKIKDLSQLFDHIMASEVPEIPDHLSKQAQDFITQCLQYDKDKRPSAKDLLQHPFVRGPGNSNLTMNA